MKDLQSCLELCKQVRGGVAALGSWHWHSEMPRRNGCTMGDAMLHHSFPSATLQSSLRQDNLHMVQIDIDSERGIKDIPTQSPVSVWSKRVQVSEHACSSVTVPKAGTSVKLVCVKGKAHPVGFLHEKQNKKHWQDSHENESRLIVVIVGDIGSKYFNFHTFVYYVMLSATFRVSDRVYALPSVSLAIELMNWFCFILFCFLW